MDNFWIASQQNISCANMQRVANCGPISVWNRALTMNSTGVHGVQNSSTSFVFRLRHIRLPTALHSQVILPVVPSIHPQPCLFSQSVQKKQDKTKHGSIRGVTFHSIFEKNHYGIHNHHVSRFDELSHSVHVTTFILHSVISVNGWLLPNWRTFSQNVVSAPT